MRQLPKKAFHPDIVFAAVVAISFVAFVGAMVENQAKEQHPTRHDVWITKLGRIYIIECDKQTFEAFEAVQSGKGRIVTYVRETAK